MAVKKYKEFLLEWGYGGEGGVASKDPVKVKDSMMTEIDLEEEEEEEDKDIPILSDIKESVDDIDPYGEENWNEVNYNYKNWKGSVYDFLEQLNNPFVSEYLEKIKKSSYMERKTTLYFYDIIDALEEDGDLDFGDITALERDIDQLIEICEDYDQQPWERDPDEWLDLKRDRERD